MENLTELSARWLECKMLEQKYQAERRKLEDKILSGRPIEEGTTNLHCDKFAVKITSRLNRKVDSDLVQEIAEENGISHAVLQSVFRWKAEVNANGWKGANEAVTKVLSKAITAKPGRPSFQITPIVEE